MSIFLAKKLIMILFLSEDGFALFNNMFNSYFNVRNFASRNVREWPPIRENNFPRKKLIFWETLQNFISYFSLLNIRSE